ncbi:hypothetical protein CPB84DRAFT_267761 [Gymnopilus junonius]|uniref:Uncharacterized protein n=1 Tax=Gymnopilus junonius TaxID=109634 RepID=A0A9P5NSY4_GYMJU|nr:hypothetical protein CPB84DRAFT_267761 [Gymnopilus junonius]
MTIWPIPDHGDECVSLSSKYSSLFTPPNSCSFVLESRPISPRLEVGNIDAVPFSQNFADLFEDLGLHAASVNSQKWQIPGHRSPDTSYDIESHTNVKEIDPAWKRDGIEEILIISPKRPGGLPTIHEDVGEVSMSMTIGDKPTAVLSDFEIEELDQAAQGWT